MPAHECAVVHTTTCASAASAFQTSVLGPNDTMLRSSSTTSAWPSVTQSSSHWPQSVDSFRNR
jgi:hypothetical protein